MRIRKAPAVRYIMIHSCVVILFRWYVCWDPRSVWSRAQLVILGLMGLLVLLIRLRTVYVHVYIFSFLSLVNRLLERAVGPPSHHTWRRRPRKRLGPAYCRPWWPSRGRWRSPSPCTWGAVSGSGHWSGAGRGVSKKIVKLLIISVSLLILNLGLKSSYVVVKRSLQWWNVIIFYET